MPNRATIALSLFSAALFAWGVPFEKLYDAFPSIITAFSVMAGAVLVRLNRTMPALDWTALEKDQRENLTREIVSLSQEYLYFIYTVSIGIIIILVFTVIGRDEIFGATKGAPNPAKAWFWQWRRLDAAVMGTIIPFICIRMAYLVWRDVDIVKLQKHVIDLSARRLHQENQERISEEKLTAIGRANLRSVATSKPKQWSD